MLDQDLIDRIVRQALDEDWGLKGDITSKAIIPHELQTTAVMRSRKSGIIAGLQAAEAAFRLADPTLTTIRNVEDGDKVFNSDILTVQGSARPILAAERTALNFTTHLSGIATLARQYCDIVAHTKAKIRCTRKTLPGLRALEKYAVRVGGGMNHRFGLDDAVLIKDNHIKVANSIKDAINNIRDYVASGVPVEIEVDTLEQLQEVLAVGGVDMVLLDNMDVPTLQKAVEMVGGKFPLEASGGVNLATVKAIAETGVNYIAVGALTHSAPALDIGLDIAL